MAEESFADPFESLIKDVASSSASPAPSEGNSQGTPNNAQNGAPQAGQANSQAEGGAKPGAQEQSTAKPAPSAPDQGAKPGTENPTVPPPEGADGKGSIPEHLKPFESILKSKQWDLSKPEGVVKALQSYQEAEQNLGRRTNDLKLLHTRHQEFEKDFQEGVPGINRRLEAMGLSKIDVPSVEDQHKYYKDVFQNIRTALNPNANEEERKAAVGKLNELVYEKLDNLRIQMAAAKGQPTQGAKSQRKSFETNSASLYLSRVGANPELNKAYDALLPHFQPGGVFHSFGLDEYSVCSSPERAAALEKIGQALHFQASAYNADGTVKENGPIDVEIKKALALAGRAANAAPAGGNKQPPAPNSNGQGDAIDSLLNSIAFEASQA